MAKRIADFTGDEAELLKRLGAGVLNAWEQIPEGIRNSIQSEAGALRGGGNNAISELSQFIERNEGEVE